MDEKVKHISVKKAKRPIRRQKSEEPLCKNKNPDFQLFSVTKALWDASYIRSFKKTNGKIPRNFSGKGDEKTVEEKMEALFAEYGNSVYRLALSFTHSVSDAEDICQTVFLKRLRQKTPPINEKAWLMQVTANESRSFLRSFWHKKVGSIEEIEEAVLPRTAENEKKKLFEAVMALPPVYRAVVYLYYYEGYSAVETASICRISKTAATTRLERARKQLKKALEENGDEG